MNTYTLIDCDGEMVDIKANSISEAFEIANELYGPQSEGWLVSSIS